MHIQYDLQYIKQDIHAVEKFLVDLYQKRDRCSTKRRILEEDASSNLVKEHLRDKHSCAIVSRIAITPGQCYESLDNDHNITVVAKSSSCHLIQKKMCVMALIAKVYQVWISIGKEAEGVHAQVSDTLYLLVKI